MAFKIFSGTANRPLAEKIAGSKEIAQKLGEVEITNFADGEQYVRFQENLRGETVFIIQPTNQPDSNLIQLFMLLKAALGASAGRVIAVIPYYGYARQERKSVGREAISASLWAQFIDSLSIERVLFMDLHANAIEGFFRNVKVDHLYARPVFIKLFKEQFKQEIGNDKLVVVSPDAGGVDRARAYARRLGGSSLAIIDKRRERRNHAEAMNVIGDVENKTALIVDDLLDTCGTVVGASDALLKKGAAKVCVVSTHGVYSGDAIEKLESSNINQVFIADTIYNHSLLLDQSKKITVLSVADLFAQAIIRTVNNQSLSALFD